MFVEIGAMTSLHIGQEIYNSLRSDAKVMLIFLEPGRSNDLFEDRQFGEYGEAATLSIIVDQSDKVEIFNKVFEYAELNEENNGVVLLKSKMVSVSPSDVPKKIKNTT